MKIKMKASRIVAAVAGCFWAVGVSAQSGVTFEVDGVNYQVRENVSEVVVALPENGMPQGGYQYPLDEDGALVIPSSVEYGGNTYAVTGVVKDAIAGQAAMTRLVLPPTMVDVMDGVHDCPSLLYLDLGGASEVSTPLDAGLPLLEELRFGCQSPLALKQGSFRVMPRLKVLRLPAQYANVEDAPVYKALWDSFQSTPVLEEIYCPAATPPLCVFSLYYTDNGESPYNGAGPIGIDDDIYNTCKVFVPVGTKYSYGVHRSWEAFDMMGNLFEMEFSGVSLPSDGAEDGITVSQGEIFSRDGSPVEVFSMAGMRMASSGLSSGVYVVRSQDGTVSKVAVR